MDIAKEIRALREKVIVHSCIYYCMDDSIVDDHTWQKWANDLEDLQKKYPAESQSVDFYKEDFADWDGSTGCFLPLLDPDIVSKAHKLMSENGRAIVEPHLPL